MPTGADRDRIGCLRANNGGTVFLDEVGELALSSQAKLLRAIETKEVQQLGSDDPATFVDVRIVAATNRKLRTEVVAGRFREDLYRRLRAGVVIAPPLRVGDIDLPALASHFLRDSGKRMGRTLQFAEDAIPAIQEFEWPGNMRDLSGVVSDAASRARGNEVGATELRGAYHHLRQTIEGDDEADHESPADPGAPPIPQDTSSRTTARTTLLPSRPETAAYFKSNPVGLGNKGFIEKAQEALKAEAAIVLARDGTRRRTVGEVARLLGVQPTGFKAFLTRKGLLGKDGKKFYVKDDVPPLG